MNICISADNNYIKHASVLIASVLHNAAISDELHFYILENKISDDSKAKIYQLKKIKNAEITFVPVDSALFEEYKNIHTHDYLTINSFYRLKMASILPELDKVIYLDCDMVVNSSLSELYNTDLKDFLAAGVKDVSSRRMNRKTRLPSNNLYVNTGMLLIDLNKWRENNIESLFSSVAKENSERIFTGDQDVINIALQGKIKKLPAKWNVQCSNFSNRSSYTKKPAIIHYVSYQKPWVYASWNYFVELYFKYLQLTPWKMGEAEYKKWTVNGKFESMLKYLKYRPLFFLHPRFWVAVICTYPR